MNRPELYVQQLRAPNDANGNPRRLWAIYCPETGDLLGIHDEGYQYSTARTVMREFYGEATYVVLPAIVTTPQEYRNLLRTARNG